jgi:hypothetical protein
VRHFLLLVSVSTAMPLPAAAQSFHPTRQYSEVDRQVSVGLTIPLGRGGSRAERQPRVDLIFDHRRRDANGLQIREGMDFRQQRPVRLGFTLSEQPQMMLNGRAAPGQNERKNFSDGAWVGLGLASAVGIALLVVIAGQNDRCSGPNGSGGCDG